MSDVYDDTQIEVLLSEQAALQERLERIQKDQAELRQKANERIRELEQAVTNLAGMGKRDEARIRELEAQLEGCGDVICGLEASRNAFQDLAEESAKRIAKARECLQDLHELGEGCRHTQLALAALEGK